MLHLIENLLARFAPAPLHRLALKVAHKSRHHWRKITKPHLSGVSVIIRDADECILLVRHTYGPDCWTLPGGGMERGEEPEAAARREMREELGIELIECESLDTLGEEISGSRHTAYLFSARAKGKIVPDGREIATARYYSADAFPQDTGAIAHRHVAVYRGG